MKHIILIMAFIASGYCSAQQLVYTPINPAFGGNTFNYQWLLSSAESQNSFTDPKAVVDNRTELERFQDNLNSQLLNSLSRNAFDAQLGDELKEGTFNVGDLALEIFDTTDGLVINILDTNTGEQTQIIVPN